MIQLMRREFSNLPSSWARTIVPTFKKNQQLRARESISSFEIRLICIRRTNDIRFKDYPLVGVVCFDFAILRSGLKYNFQTELIWI